MEDSYANYTIDPGALKEGLSVLGFIAGGIGAALAICNPVSGTALALAGVCTGVGILCDSLTLTADLAEGNKDEFFETAGEDALEIILKKLRLEGLMQTGAGFTKEEIEAIEALFVDMPNLAFDVVESHDIDLSIFP